MNCSFINLLRKSDSAICLENSVVNLTGHKHNRVTVTKFIIIFIIIYVSADADVRDNEFSGCVLQCHKSRARTYVTRSITVDRAAN